LAIWDSPQSSASATTQSFTNFSTQCCHTEDCEFHLVHFSFFSTSRTTALFFDLDFAVYWCQSLPSTEQQIQLPMTWLSLWSK
jgi:hypothetical protein